MPYIGKSTTIGVRQRYMYTATASQTTFSGTDTQNLTLTYTDSNFVDVYLNGVLLKTGTDYTATSGTSVVLASGAVADDIVEIIVYDAFAVANFYNRTDSDSRYVNIDGDTMTGALAGTTATFSGIIKTDDTTDATSTTDGSLQTDGGLSVVKKSVFGDDITIISGSSPEIKIAPNDATAAFFKGDSNRSSAGQHLTEFQGYWNGTQVARIVVAAGDDTTNKDDGHLDFYTTPSGGSSTRAMRIKSDGNVGIGTDNPSTGLSVVTGSANGIELGQDSDASTDSARLFFSTSGGSNAIHSSSGAMRFFTGSTAGSSSGTERAVIGTSEAVFNEASNDYDFRVESNGNANMFFVDAGNDVIKIGGDSSGFISNSVNIYGASVNPPGTTAGNLLVNSTDSMAADKGGSITLGGKYTSGGTMYHFGAIQAVKLNSSSGNAAGVFKAYVTNSSNGSNAFLEADETEVVFNEAGGNVDFRVEADANDNAFRVDAGANSGVGAVLFGQSSPDTTANGAYFSLSTANNKAHLVVANTETSNSLALVFLNRQQSDGALMQFRHEDSSEGSISVSGSTVSYNGFSGRHESSGIPTNTPVGTVVSTIDELDVYPNTTTDTEGNTVTHKKAGQTRADHAKVEISNSSGDTCVYGVVSEFDNDGKLIVTSVGIGSILVTGACNKGDLLESNGDGTAKVQSDDIIRSKTIGKVTIGNSGTGVKLVSCVLYCG